MYKLHHSLYELGLGSYCEYTGPASLPSLSGEFSILCLFCVDASDVTRHKRIMNIGDRTVGPHLGMGCTMGNSFNLSGGWGTTGASAAVSIRKNTYWNIGCLRRATNQISLAACDVDTFEVNASASYAFTSNVPVAPITVGAWNNKLSTEYFSGGIQWVVILDTFISNPQLQAVARGDYRVLEEFSQYVVEAWDIGSGSNPVGVNGTPLTAVNSVVLTEGGPDSQPLRSTWSATKLNEAFAAMQALDVIEDVRSGVVLSSIEGLQEFEARVRRGRAALEGLLRL